MSELPSKVLELMSNLTANGIYRRKFWPNIIYQPAITCSKLTIETLERGVKYVQS